VVDRFVSRGLVAIGEKGDLTPSDIAKILEIQMN